MSKLVLLRHSRSAWNVKNLFTGWVDVPLAPEGLQDAQKVAENLKGYEFDVVYTSKLIRAHETLLRACSKFKNGKVPVFVHGGAREKHAPRDDSIPVLLEEALNERYYGKLQGLNKKEMAEKYGAEQVKLWRRSYRVRPPGGESLQDTARRTLACFDGKILPRVKKGENALVVAHGNSLRAIVMKLDRLSEEEVPQLEIPFDKFIEYEYHKGKMLCKRIV